MHQRRVTNFWSCITDNHSGARQHFAMIKVFAAFMGTKASNNIDTTS
jgi:hypothetical protein